MSVALLGACDEAKEGDDHGDEDGHDHETEVITTVTLTFTAEGGEVVTASFRDPDGDGGMSGSSEPIVLAPETTYTLSVSFLNELEDPDHPEDLTSEIEAEAEEHQLFLYGSVAGPASMVADSVLTHAYADLESDYGPNAHGEDLPVGLVNTITTTRPNEGQLQVMLRHLPELNEEPQKEAGLAELFATDPAALPGDTDVDVRFDVTVK